MRVAVISDTHMPVNIRKFPEDFLEKLKGVDMIIHAGDLIELSVLDELNKIAPTKAVTGNMDSHKARKALPEKLILELGGFKIGVIHGLGHPDKILEYVMERFKDEKLDCIIYGHSHNPKIETIEGTIYFNPGSMTDKVFAPYNSYGILEIDDKLTPKIVRL
ncbi:MAG: metallophosphoesterase family protein [Candidatus Omnitrophica bacterium]|nr:metallophosphoesterase family protein [Candidatus Omnitrophota bacterium]